MKYEIIFKSLMQLYDRTTGPVLTKLGTKHPCMGEGDSRFYKWLVINVMR